MATQALSVVQAPRSIALEIEQDLDARNMLEAALAEIDKELAAAKSDAARQLAAQAGGKTLADITNLAVTLFKAAVAREEKAQEKKNAVAYLLPAVEERIMDWRTSAPSDLVAVLDRKIAEQTSVVGREKDEAVRVQAVLDRLKSERSAVSPASATTKSTGGTGGSAR